MSVNLVNNFVHFFGEKPDFYLDAGGRYEICGNHTDHNHGLCLVANASLRIKCVLKKLDGVVKVKSRGYKPFEFNINDLEPKENEFSTSKALCKGVLFKLKQNGYKIGGFEAYITSDIPNGSGVSSSAAIESLFGFIISELYNGGKISRIELAKDGQFSENTYFNKPCGMLDQIGTSFDSSNFIDFKDIKNPVVETLKFNLPITIFLIKSEGDHANLTPLYAAIPSSMNKIAKLLEDKVYLRDVNDENIFDRIDAISESDLVKNKAKHFFIENQNVLNCKKAIEENNIENFVKYIRASQDSSCKNLKNTFVEGEYENSPQSIIDKVAPVLGENGAVRIHGGGFKGTVICFVKNSFAKDFEKYLKGNYKKKEYFKVYISPNAVNFKKI